MNRMVPKKGKDDRMVKWMKMRLKLLWMALTIKPIAGGAPEGDEGGEGDGEDSPEGKGGEGEGKEGEGKPSGEGGGDDDNDGDDEDGGGEPSGEGKPEPDWKKIARRNENRLKKERRERERLEKEAKDRADADKTEHEKEVEKARQEGERTAAEKANATRQRDQLENAVIRRAAKGIKVGEGDDAKDRRFADPDDAMMHVLRAVDAGDVDMEELFTDQGAVNSDLVTETLSEILSSKPYLAAGDKSSDDPPKPPAGSADGGKGSDDAKGLEDMSVEDHFNRIKRSDESSGVRELP